MVCSADDHEYRLVEHLMRDYDPRIRPSKNASEALNVTFGMALAQIIDVVSNCGQGLGLILDKVEHWFIT